MDILKLFFVWFCSLLVWYYSSLTSMSCIVNTHSVSLMEGIAVRGCICGVKPTLLTPSFLDMTLYIIR